MTTNNHWITLSRGVYARLLYLYPVDHRIEYGPSMLQAFTDQCRSAQQKAGVRGSIVLWLRTLIDLLTSSLREHLTSPGLLNGLLEAVPGEPLPWKGVLLVLVPGLVFVIGQVAQLAGTDWFFLMAYRAAYWLIVPVALAGLITRKIPIWGLIPIGLLYKTIGWAIYRLRDGLVGYAGPALSGAMRAVSQYDVAVREAAVAWAVLAGLILLTGWMARRGWMTRRVWAWIGAYAALGGVLILYRWYTDSRYAEVSLSQIAYWNIFAYGGFLLLILLGGLLARRHGRLAMLLPLGYLLPTVLFGRFDADWETPQFMALVGGGAVVFRLLVAVAAPLWILRATPGEAQRRAAVGSLLGVQAIQTILEVSANGLRWQLTVDNLSSIVLAQLVLAAGIFLASDLYQSAAATGAEHQPGAPVSAA